MGSLHFEYEAQDQNGQTVSGTIAAADRGEALKKLQSAGLRPRTLCSAENRESFWQKQFSFGQQRVRPGQMSAFFSQLANLLDAGMPVDRSLALMGRVWKNGQLKAFIHHGYTQVQGGASLAQAWSQNPLLPSYGLSMLQAGEASGNLSLALRNISEVLDRNSELRSTVSTGLAYPAFLLLVTISVVVGLVVYAIPQFLDIFALWGGELPAATRFLVELSEAVRRWGWAFALVIGALIAGIAFWTTTPQGKIRWDSFVLRLPVIGTALRDASAARLFRTLSAMLNSGVGLPQALRYAAGAGGNRRLAQGFMRAARKVENGVALSSILAGEGVYPEMITELVAIGEEAGELGPVIAQGAELLEAETKRWIKYMTTLLEPVMLLVMAVVIGFVVLGILLPIVTIMEIPM